MPFAGYQVFGAFTVTEDRWHITYPYCMDGMLTNLYDERVGSGGFTLTSATGTCTFANGTTQTPVDFPAFTIPTPDAFGNATVHGADIDLDHGAGTIALGGAREPAVVFNTVDCSTTCGSPGWYELHTIVWDDATHAATFVIIYLNTADATHVQLAYALRLPSLDNPFGTVTLPAVWTGTAARTQPDPPAHIPPPWLRLDAP